MCCHKQKGRSLCNQHHSHINLLLSAGRRDRHLALTQPLDYAYDRSDIVRLWLRMRIAWCGREEYIHAKAVHWRKPMKEASLNKRHTYPAASALLRAVTVALLILAPVVLASAQSSGPPSDSASAGRSRAEDGATRISSDSERDPISLEAIQEGAKNFELRRSEMDDTRSNAAHTAAAAERRARDASKSDETAQDTKVSPVERRPPRDAVPHQGIEASLCSQGSSETSCRLSFAQRVRRPAAACRAPSHRLFGFDDHTSPRD